MSSVRSGVLGVPNGLNGFGPKPVNPLPKPLGLNSLNIPGASSNPPALPISHSQASSTSNSRSSSNSTGSSVGSGSTATFTLSNAKFPVCNLQSL